MIRKADFRPTALQWLRPLGWSLAALILAMPLLAMQFEDRLQLGVNWSLSDFAVAAFLLGGTGAALEVAVRLSGNLAFRATAVLGIGAALAMVWVNLAVGLVGAESNGANLWFMFVPVAGLVAAAIGRFEARGMVRAMLAMAVAQVIAGVLAGGGMQAVSVTLVWGACWLVSAWLFKRAC
ncbi:MAG: hypothetical protein ACO1OX_05585 [Novosphingobium sp.]